MKEIMNVLKKKVELIAGKLNPKHVLTVTTLNAMMVFNTVSVHATGSNTESIDGFIDFACDWLAKIGGVVALVGGVMFALSWQRDDAEGKSRALMTLMAGFMLVAITMARSIFGL